jgi:site-specific DNA-methyltransferase (adenine-specific)
LNLPAPYYQDEAVQVFHGRCEDIVPCLDLSEVAMVLADPPYGIGIQDNGGGARRNAVGTNGRSYPGVIDGDRQPYAVPVELSCLLSHASCVFWGANNYSDCLPRSQGWLVWDKRPSGLLRTFADGELAWTNWDTCLRIFRHTWDGFDRASERGDHVHPNQKPVALMKWCLGLAKLEPGALVLDPYTGSGPVLAAAKVMGYRAIGIDSLEWCCARAAERCRQGALPLAEVNP